MPKAFCARNLGNDILLKFNKIFNYKNYEMKTNYGDKTSDRAL